LKDINGLIGVVRNQAQWFEMKARAFTDASKQLYCDQHALIVDSLQSRNPQSAREAMIVHLQSVKQNLLGL
jgi:DNA-binding FadR family transcriptional regulator